MRREAASSQAGSPWPGCDTSTVDKRLRECAISSNFARQRNRHLQTGWPVEPPGLPAEVAVPDAHMAQIP